MRSTVSSCRLRKRDFPLHSPLVRLYIICRSTSLISKYASHELVVLEVSCEADVPEDRLLKLEARMEEVVVDTHRRDLCLERRVLAMQPEHVAVVLLHELDERVHTDAVQPRGQARLHDLVARNVDVAHGIVTRATTTTEYFVLKMFIQCKKRLRNPAGPPSA